MEDGRYLISGVKISFFTSMAILIKELCVFIFSTESRWEEFSEQRLKLEIHIILRAILSNLRAMFSNSQKILFGFS